MYSNLSRSPLKNADPPCGTGFQPGEKGFPPGEEGVRPGETGVAPASSQCEHGPKACVPLLQRVARSIL